MKQSNRRDFLKKAAAGGAAAGIVSGIKSADAKTPFNRVIYRELGSTGEKVSEMGFGVMNNRDADLINAAIDSGINYLDTAHYYMNGANEEIVGSVMKTKRDKVFLTTKVGLSKKIDDIPREIATSLKRLKTDYVDLLLFHKTDSRAEILDEKIMRIFEDARKKGQTRFVGFSTHNFGAEPFDAAIDSNFWEAVLTSYNYFTPPIVVNAVKKTREAGIAIIGMKNLITVERPRKPFPDIREGKTKTTTNQQALLKWVLDDENIDTIIPGMTSFEQLRDNLAVMGTKLTQDDRNMIRRYCDGVRTTYCQGVAGCTGCKEKCPYGVSVKDINRILMYAYGYGSMDLARENYRQLPRSQRVEACSGCEECSVQCVNGLNLSDNVRKARELFA